MMEARIFNSKTGNYEIVGEDDMSSHEQDRTVRRDLQRAAFKVQEQAIEEVDQKVEAYAEEHGCDYQTALNAVLADNPDLKLRYAGMGGER